MHKMLISVSLLAAARTPHNRVRGITREQSIKHFTQVVMTIFGLTHTRNTKVAPAMHLAHPITDLRYRSETNTFAGFLAASASESASPKWLLRAAQSHVGTTVREALTPQQPLNLQGHFVSLAMSTGCATLSLSTKHHRPSSTSSTRPSFFTKGDKYSLALSA